VPRRAPRGTRPEQAEVAVVAAGLGGRALHVVVGEAHPDPVDVDRDGRVAESREHVRAGARVLAQAGPVVHEHDRGLRAGLRSVVHHDALEADPVVFVLDRLLDDVRLRGEGDGGQELLVRWGESGHGGHSTPRV
jgi:hypothetical protein